MFLWNGTTSGVKVPNGDWIPADREGLTICDATSAAFAMDLPWDKLDVTTFSWQKVLGGEAAHGMLILSPARRGAAGKLHAALADAEDLPHDQGRQDRGRHFRRRDHQHAVDGGGGRLSRRPDLGGKRRRAERPDRALQRQSAGAGRLGRQDRGWAGFLAKDAAIRSNTSVCIEDHRSLVHRAWPTTPRPMPTKKIAALLEKEGVALDIAGYRAAPPGLRIWCGATVDKADLEALTPWLDWAWAQVKG